VNLRLVSGGPHVTRGIGAALGRAAIGPLMILLTGDYGTGKTTLVQGLARGLGIAEPVRSPSYNILKSYATGRLMLVHADLYRTRSLADIGELGIFEIMTPDGILAVEWPGSYLPPAADMPTLTVNMSMPPAVPGQEDASASLRRIEFNWDDNCPGAVQEVLRALAA